MQGNSDLGEYNMQRETTDLTTADMDSGCPKDKSAIGRSIPLEWSLPGTKVSSKLVGAYSVLDEFSFNEEKRFYSVK